MLKFTLVLLALAVYAAFVLAIAGFAGFNRISEDE